MQLTIKGIDQFKEEKKTWFQCRKIKKQLRKKEKDKGDKEFNEILIIDEIMEAEDSGEEI